MIDQHNRPSERENENVEIPDQQLNRASKKIKILKPIKEASE